MHGKIVLQNHCKFTKRRAGLSECAFLRFWFHRMLWVSFAIQWDEEQPAGSHIAAGHWAPQKRGKPLLACVSPTRLSGCICCLLVQQIFNNRGVSKQLELIYTLWAWAESMNKFRVQTGRKSSDNKPKEGLRWNLIGLCCGDYRTQGMHALWAGCDNPRDPHPALHWPDSTFGTHQRVI